jgi:AbrB family looped-hinge helix DNA binding protein
MRSATTKICPRFRIVIPKKIRDAAGIKEGDFIEAEVRPGPYEDALKGLDEAVKRERERGLGSSGIPRGPRVKELKSR